MFHRSVFASSRDRARARVRAPRRAFGITRSIYFWPLCLLVGPQCVSVGARAVLVLVPAAVTQTAVAGEPEGNELTPCVVESQDCRTFCIETKRTTEELDECLLVCEEIFDRCVFEMSGNEDEGCDADDEEVVEAVACAVLVGAQVACEIGAETCNAQTGEDYGGSDSDGAWASYDDDALIDDDEDDEDEELDAEELDEDVEELDDDELDEEDALAEEDARAEDERVEKAVEVSR